MSFQLQSVLITDEIDVQCVEILQKNGIQVVKNTKLTKEQLIAEIPVSNLQHVNRNNIKLYRQVLNPSLPLG